jgi:NAD(P)-dependent dehydrogenase (short-subunit alcohol dehydrogenase family)
MTNSPSLRLSGKVCVITGTGGSIGRAAAVAFAREGASVVGCDVNVGAAEATAEMVRAQGGTMISRQPCHLTQPSECQALVDFAVREYGRIDVLFNNAAMAYFNWLEDITDDEWNRDLREEVDLVFFLTRAAWPQLKASHGVVVNTASLNALLSFKTLGSLAHTTAKAGIIGMTRQLAMEGREHGIRARTAEGPRMGDRDARQDAARTSRPARGSGQRCAVPGLGRKFLRDGHRYRGRWRHEGLVNSLAQP